MHTDLTCLYSADSKVMAILRILYNPQQLQVSSPHLQVTYLPFFTELFSRTPSSLTPIMGVSIHFMRMRDVNGVLLRSSGMTSGISYHLRASITKLVSGYEGGCSRSVVLYEIKRTFLSDR